MPQTKTYLSLLLTLLFLSVSTASMQARGARTRNIYHRVKQGEYLGLIARKYKTSIHQLRRWNRMSSGETLRAGKLLKVGLRKYQKARRTRAISKKRIPKYHRVRKGESLSLLARRYRVSVAALQRWNRMGKQSTLRKGRRLIVGYRILRLKSKPLPKGTKWMHLTSSTKVKLPLNYTPPKPKLRNLENRYYNLRIFAASFSQGKAAYLELTPRRLRSRKTKQAGSSPSVSSAPKNVRIRFLKKDIPLTRTHWGYRAIFAIPPELRPGVHILRVSLQALTPKGALRNIRFVHRLRIARTRYPVSIWRRNVGPPGGKHRPPNPETIALIKRSTRKKEQVFRRRSQDSFQPRLSHPRDLHKITSPFYTTRKYVRYFYRKRKRVYLKSRFRKHGGTDLRGVVGAPIYAMADGTVVAAQKMFYEGNFTIVDHGNGIFTGYMHQSKFLVYEGEKVIAGQLIGRCGATGKVTGAHLHMSLWIRGVTVDPLSLLSLPVR